MKIIRTTSQRDVKYKITLTLTPTASESLGEDTELIYITDTFAVDDRFHKLWIGDSQDGYVGFYFYQIRSFLVEFISAD